jgi:hypothetical protein
MADFDGDNKLDVATLGTPEIRIEFNAVESPAFMFLVRPAANRLSARDLDGDNDRDLVLETPMRVPLAVWINDGAGHFKPGDLDHFRFLLSHDDPRSLGSSERPLAPGRMGECPRRGAVRTQLGRRGLEPADGKIVEESLERPGAGARFHAWTRGPPA